MCAVLICGCFVRTALGLLGKSGGEHKPLYQSALPMGRGGEQKHDTSHFCVDCVSVFLDQHKGEAGVLIKALHNSPGECIAPAAWMEMVESSSRE